MKYFDPDSLQSFELPELPELNLPPLSDEELAEARKNTAVFAKARSKERKPIQWHPDNLLMRDLGIFNPIKLVWLFIVVMFLISFVVRIICAIQGTNSGMW